MIPDPVDIVYCEVCELPHQRGVARCEECKHLLGTAPNWELLRLDVSVERNKGLAGVAATFVVGRGRGLPDAASVVASCVSMMLLAGRAWIVPIVALLAWSLNHGRRWRAIAKRLKTSGAPQRG